MTVEPTHFLTLFKTVRIKVARPVRNWDKCFILNLHHWSYMLANLRKNRFLFSKLVDCLLSDGFINQNWFKLYSILSFPFLTLRDMKFFDSCFVHFDNLFSFFFLVSDENLFKFKFLTSIETCPGFDGVDTLPSYIRGRFCFLAHGRFCSGFERAT